MGHFCPSSLTIGSRLAVGPNLSTSSQKSDRVPRPWNWLFDFAMMKTSGDPRISTRGMTIPNEGRRCASVGVGEALSLWTL